MSYWLIPRIRVRAANAMVANYAVGAVPVLAINLFVHKLGLVTRCRPVRVAILHHDAQLLGEYGTNDFYQFHPQQRRGATFINSRDYSSHNKHALSLQPTVSCHLTLSLLIEMLGQARKPAIETFLSTARISGGQIDGHGELQSDPELDGVMKGAHAITSGFWVVERSDLIDPAAPVESLIRALGTRPPVKARMEERENAPMVESLPPSKSVTSHALGYAWLAPAVLGYAMITPFDRRTGVRQAEYPSGHGETLHAFSEPLLGVVQYVPSRQLIGSIPFWQHRWLRDDVFVVQQSPASHF